MINANNEIIEFSSGYSDVALTMICAERGRPFECVTDPNFISLNLIMMQVYGENFITIDEVGDGSFVTNSLKDINQILSLTLTRCQSLLGCQFMIQQFTTYTTSTGYCLRAF